MVDHRSHRIPRIALFCGGRGSATITRALLRNTNCQLSLLINGFDDGRSTGTVRKLIPGMLGPSDFRKNLATALDLSAPYQDALQRLVEQRLNDSQQLFGNDGLFGFVNHGDPARLSLPLAPLFSGLDPSVRARIRAHLERFFAYLAVTEQYLAAGDIAIGNLLFAGIYLQTRDVNTALRTFVELGLSKADILNVCDGACRWLVGLKEDGEVLASESAIVGPQSATAITHLYLLAQPLEPAQRQTLALLTWREKHAWLSQHEALLGHSAAAVNALAAADVIIFGPGTQHSSLLPSYRILADALSQSRAPLKLLIINLEPDYDNQSQSASDLIDRALIFMKDPDNAKQCISHTLYNTARTGAGAGVNPGKLAYSTHYRGIKIIRGDFRDPHESCRHHGVRVVQTVFDLLDQMAGAMDARLVY